MFLKLFKNLKNHKNVISTQFIKKKKNERTNHFFKIRLKKGYTFDLLLSFCFYVTFVHRYTYTHIYYNIYIKCKLELYKNSKQNWNYYNKI